MAAGTFWYLIITIVVACQWTATVSAMHCIHHNPVTHENHYDYCPEHQKQYQRNTLENRIYLDIKCDSDHCEKATATFHKAADIISSVVKFETPIQVNASFLSFCSTRGECKKDNDMKAIGLAYPTVSYLMNDPTDGVTRMYPQAMLKQFTNLTVIPRWATYDINAMFNSDISWYFYNDSGKIHQNETDLLRTVIHELVHGLGFISSWGDEMYNRFAPYVDDLPQFITPAKLTPSTELQSVADNVKTSVGTQPFWGFVEFPLDRLLYTTILSSPNEQVPLTHYTKVLNGWCDANVLFASMIDMVNTWYGSTERQTAEAMYQLATTSRDISICSTRHENDDGNGPTLQSMFWLETSLVPFMRGSTFTHVDQDSYQSSAEYLMVYNADRGVSLDSLTEKYSSGPLGPNLRTVLLDLGYALQPQFTNGTIADGGTIKNFRPSRPNVSYWAPADNLVGTTPNPSASIRVQSYGPAHMPVSSSATSSAASSTAIAETSGAIGLNSHTSPPSTAKIMMMMIMMMFVGTTII
ncbi:hypothetical protein J3Q64DRAFT_1695254 [Phycomyces blakesleeanus]|uniref:Sequence orphan n=2 Tax=Phycomyces blakesleeanus TaxID=4837 RepID=A0A167NZM1_PHYB8|nr:hypothetical protein PHYBLDRAFT_142460 [Phycomyces blakesleeanus NRRL 1555(-)]OAD76951.1 hypothetical protein PHYBLDRAFT_142460 [Phycomyces blakesleeanus NRRL 1555(-)]|eukprot:XP_018294991.1 hypothetical protein PHYBLDRAFT_142460 [Phycomyces blakesleeanus NRRL 1555(-)]